MTATRAPGFRQQRADGEAAHARADDDVVVLRRGLGLRYHEAILALRFASSASRNCLGRQVRLARADEDREVLRHLAGLDGLDADLLERVGELHDVGRAVELAAVLEALRPREDRRDRVRRRRLALLVLAVVARHRAVRGLGLDGLAVGRHQHGRHQAERAEALRDRVGLDVAVVVLAGPDEAAVPLERGRDHVVDQAVLVDDALRLELAGELLVEDLLEQVLEPTVVLLEDRVLRRQVDRPAAVEAVVASSCARTR